MLRIALGMISTGTQFSGKDLTQIWTISLLTSFPILLRRASRDIMMKKRDFIRFTGNYDKLQLLT